MVLKYMLLNLNLIRILFYRNTLVGYDLSAFYMFLLMFYMFHLYCVIHLFEHFNVIELFKLNNIIIIYYYHYICAQSGNNCLQSYNELCVCGNLMLSNVMRVCSNLIQIV